MRLKQDLERVANDVVLIDEIDRLVMVAGHNPLRSFAPKHVRPELGSYVSAMAMA
jgi:hypothetical protein